MSIKNIKNVFTPYFFEPFMSPKNFEALNKAIQYVDERLFVDQESMTFIDKTDLLKVRKDFLAEDVDQELEKYILENRDKLLIYLDNKIKFKK